MILGSPIRERVSEWDAAADDLDPILRGVAELITGKLGSTDAAAQASREWLKLTRLGNSSFDVNARRAALLFAFHREVSVREHFRESDSAFVDELQPILQILVPTFYSQFFQSPDAFVVAVGVAASMWHASDFGAVGPFEEGRAWKAPDGVTSTEVTEKALAPP